MRSWFVFLDQKIFILFIAKCFTCWNTSSLIPIKGTPDKGFLEDSQLTTLIPPLSQHGVAIFAFQRVTRTTFPFLLFWVLKAGCLRKRLMKLATSF